jgi:CDP-diacylglycerol--glycerol-3-phosphate 3-phosphatidyltransferase
MKKLIAIPALISSLRIGALPEFSFLFAQKNTVGCLILLTFCATTDYLDGSLARKLDVTSRFGTYYDALTDFILMIGIFTIFYGVGYYSVWFLTLIALSFIQFVATSQYTKKIYDPVGRYIGSTLYIGTVLTLIYPIQESFNFVHYAFLGFFLVSLISRIISLTRKQS